MEESFTTTQCGQIRGMKTKTGYAFLGIPYGKAERFREAKPVTWEGILDCRDYGAVAPQPNYRNCKPENWEYALVGSEDCLNLNIWTASMDPEAKLPVVVLVHGGAFQAGWNSNPEWSGDRFMEDDKMVYVSVNYRVGVMGFLELGDRYGGKYRGSGNNGMRDLLLSFRWIRDNIQAFGGDPDRLILMGISAGSKAIGALMTHPEIQKCCHRVFLESGAFQAFRDTGTAEEVTRRYLEYLPEGMDLLTADVADLVEAQGEMCSRDGNTCFFGPVLEAPFRTDWKERWAAGERFRGRAMIGSGRHELIKLVQKDYFLDQAEAIAKDMFGDNAGIAIEKYNSMDGDERERWDQVFSDFMYRYYSDRLMKQLEEEGNLVWGYSFEYPPACHGMGFAYLMKQLTPPGGNITEEQMARSEIVSDFFRKRVREFILQDEPDRHYWPVYQGGNKMIFDLDSHMEYRPEDTLTGFPDEVFHLNSNST